MKEAFLNLCTEPVDPIIEWLETLPAWDGEPRMRRLWIDTLGMPDDELSKERRPPILDWRDTPRLRAGRGT